MALKRLWWVGLLVMVLVVACAPTAPSKDPSGSQNMPVATPALTLAADVKPEDVHKIYQQGGVVIVDVRELDEYQAGHIPGAVLIPLGQLPKRLQEVPRDTEVILVCRSGNRSHQAYAYLRDQGFTNVHNMPGGMNAWIAAGYEIEH